MSTRRAPFVLIAVLALLLVACGDDSGGVDTLATATTATETTDATDTPGATETTAETPPPAAGGSAGTVQVDGTSHGLTEALLCEDDEALADLGIEQELELQGLGSGVQVDLNIYTFMGMEVQDVSWFGPEGIFSNSATLLGGVWVTDEDETLSGPPIRIDSGRAVGTMVLYDAFGEGESITVTFDVAIPPSSFACR